MIGLRTRGAGSDVGAARPRPARRLPLASPAATASEAQSGHASTSLAANAPLALTSAAAGAPGWPASGAGPGGAGTATSASGRSADSAIAAVPPARGRTTTEGYRRGPAQVGARRTPARGRGLRTVARQHAHRATGAARQRLPGMRWSPLTTAGGTRGRRNRAQLRGATPSRRATTQAHGGTSSGRRAAGPPTPTCVGSSSCASACGGTPWSWYARTAPRSSGRTG